jgi:hypothetical protein
MRGREHGKSNTTSRNDTRELLRDGVVLHSKTWRESIPRDLQ